MTLAEVRPFLLLSPHTQHSAWSQGEVCGLTLLPPRISMWLHITGDIIFLSVFLKAITFLFLIGLVLLYLVMKLALK